MQHSTPILLSRHDEGCVLTRLVVRPGRAQQHPPASLRAGRPCRGRPAAASATLQVRSSCQRALPIRQRRPACTASAPACSQPGVPAPAGTAPPLGLALLRRCCLPPTAARTANGSTALTHAPQLAALPQAALGCRLAAAAAPHQAAAAAAPAEGWPPLPLPTRAASPPSRETALAEHTSLHARGDSC